ncbi:MAG: carbohydrate binding family 9 domain-containing protein [Thermoanaerobaculia bacterium]|nr:carbohydrate binding family 9 domain-containing protein [Thermoanaerobaculia bacterium]
MLKWLAGLGILALPVIAAEYPVQLQIRRVSTSITIDGALNEEAWRNAGRTETFYETNPGDNVEPNAATVAFLAYDDKFIYAGFEFSDPHPDQIRSNYGDHDQIGGNTDDYGGLILDTRNDRKTAVLLLANARAIQYDAITDDASGEDSSPDFYWDAATKIHEKGWTLEMRVPFSSLRYQGGGGPQEWGLLLYRNWPRDRRYQMFSAKLPRGGNCFICNRNPLTGLSDLPEGGHIIAAPYVTARQAASPRNDVVGNPLENEAFGSDAGVDVKWTPNADMAIDATLNPDFSQVESDVAAITTNERFAIFFPEKRPFFLEGVELFSTPIQAAYTRTITSPRWGLRTTGKYDANAYTLLIAQDRGGGKAILPSAEGSEFADQSFSSTVAIGRVKRDFGTSFVSILGTLRESGGSAYNRVLGPDFRMQLGNHDSVTGQLLFSGTKEPDRVDLNEKWNGEELSSYAGFVSWGHSTKHFDLYTEYNDRGEDFRADNGFVPQVGYRGAFAESGYTWRPTKGYFNRIRPFVYGQYDSLQSGPRLYNLATAGINADGRWQSSSRLRFSREGIRTGGKVLTRDRILYSTGFSPGAKIARINIDGWFGDDIDFRQSRLGRGASISLGGTIRPNSHLQLDLTNAVRWLSIEGDRLFTAQLERVRAQYTFNSRMFVRAIVQNERTNRDVVLHEPVEVERISGALAGQLLFAYKLNWQTVLFLGVGDLREEAGSEGDLERAGQEVFVKLSYAFQR